MTGIRWTFVPLLTCAACVAQAGWLDETELELRFDDNLPRGQLKRDIKSDMAVAVTAEGGHGYQVTDNGRLTLTMTLSATGYRQYSGLDHVDAGVGVAYRHKFGLGPLAPEARASISATRLEYRHDGRDGWLYSAQLGVGKRLTERLGLTATYEFERRKSDYVLDRLLPTVPADVFDLTSRNFTLGGDYTLSSDYVLSAAYTIRNGDVVSTTMRNLPIFLVSSAIAEDPVFGGDRYAYKMKAITRGASLGVSRLINDRSSFTVGYEYIDSRAEGGVDYQANIVRAIYLHQF
ncbi:MAG TPA: hypothetical protein VJ673_20995 [Aromatoleum sp.]|uniref:hypothetical protein n=1 Tax=Aromatoleum sp. TaxID=2307007 RepID=UPI002B464B04|nr:hypothetical protein [Aromatoleum sp.]HJV28166.1 hypothetical protein [Aromatoleum sp.]